MNDTFVAHKIKKQIESLILESILAVLDKLAEQVAIIRNSENKTQPEEKF